MLARKPVDDQHTHPSRPRLVDLVEVRTAECTLKVFRRACDDPDEVDPSGRPARIGEPRRNMSTHISRAQRVRRSVNFSLTTTRSIHSLQHEGGLSWQRELEAIRGWWRRRLPLDLASAFGQTTAC